MKKVNVALIGYKFMGRAHSNAWIKAPLFFDLNLLPIKKVVCGRHPEPLKEFARQWGWEETETDWEKVVTRKDIDIIDISLPPYLHHNVAIAAAKNGKHIFCEKPLALNSAQSKEMYDAAQKSGVVHYINFNYRRCPAVGLAKQLIEKGKIGQIFHWRGAYLQSWIIDPNFPLTWHLRKELAGGGPQWDLNSHSVDLARFLIGDIKKVMGMKQTFIKERPLPNESQDSDFNASDQNQQIGTVTVDDATFMMVEFENGALGSFDSSRFANGRKNYNYFEIYGSRGSILFDLEKMNELQYFSVDDPEYAQGFRTIQVTESVHPYISHWWPVGHIIGYEHGFIHAVADFLDAIAKNQTISPNFFDGLKVIEVLEAGLKSAESGKIIEL